MDDLRLKALQLVDEERDRQTEKWGIQRRSWPEWISILGEEFGEAAQQVNEIHFDPTGVLDQEPLLMEVVQVAAVAVSMIEQLLDPDYPLHVQQTADILLAIQKRPPWQVPIQPARYWREGDTAHIPGYYPFGGTYIGSSRWQH